MSSISINGLRIEMRGDDVYINGQLVGPVEGPTVKAPAGDGNRELVLGKDGQVNGDVHGDLNVKATGLFGLFGKVTLVVNGNVGGNVTCDGEVRCQNVGGGIASGGDVHANVVGGSVNARGLAR